MKSITAVGLLFVSAALQLSSVAAGPCKNDSADPGCCLQMAEWTGNDGRLQRAPLVFDQLTGACQWPMDYQKFLQDNRVPGVTATKNVSPPKKTSINSKSDGNNNDTKSRESEGDGGDSGGEGKTSDGTSQPAVYQWMPLSAVLYALLSLIA